MAQKSPWGAPLMTDADWFDKAKFGPVQDPDAQALLERLKYGPVQPSAAALGQVQPSTISMGGSPSPNPVDMTAAQPSPQEQKILSANEALAHVKNSFAKSEDSNSNKHLRTTNRMMSLDPDQIRATIGALQGINYKRAGFKPAVDENGVPLASGEVDESQPIYDWNQSDIDPNNPAVQQKAGLARMDDMLKMQAEANTKTNKMDWRPLAALADAVAQAGGRQSNLAASAEAPQNSNDKIMAYADEMQKRLADVNKETMSGLKSMKGGSIMDSVQQMQLEKMLEGYGSPSGQNMQARIDQAQWNRAHIAHDALMRRIASDPLARQELQGYNTLSNSLALIQNTDSLTPQQLMEAQRKIMQGMSMSGGSGQTLGDERAQMYLKDIGQDADRVIQYFSGQPVNIKKNDPIVQHIKNMAGIEQQNYQNLYNSRLNALIPGSNWIYADGDKWGLKPSLDAAIAANQAQVSKVGPTFTLPQKNKTSGSGGAGIPSLNDINAEIARRKGSR